MKAKRIFKIARDAGWMPWAEVLRREQDIRRQAIEETTLKNEATILLASQAKEVGDMYKKLLETTTQERIKFFQKDPRGLYAEAMQKFIVAQQFLGAFDVWDAMRSNENWRHMMTCKVEFESAVRSVLP